MSYEPTQRDVVLLRAIASLFLVLPEKYRATHLAKKVDALADRIQEGVHESADVR